MSMVENTSMNPVTDCSKCPKNVPAPDLPIDQWYFYIKRKVTQDSVTCTCRVVKGKME